MKKTDNIKNLISYTDRTRTADLPELSLSCERNGADAVLINARGASEDEFEELIKALRKSVEKADIRHYVIYEPKKLEGVKKLIYAGAAKVYIPETCGPEIIKEAAERFTGKVGSLCNDQAGELLKEYEDGGDTLIADNADEVLCRKAFETEGIDAVASKTFAEADYEIYGLKKKLSEQGIDVNLFKSSVPFEEFKLNESGLIPVIVQEYKTGRVLMLAYMNREAYEKTLATGRMTYYSRSRQELWTKGET
ncbi:MAG: hypothetical protein IJL97_03680, partial [Lachnospiraceae bacterium]|nr:hypothetical protein [Lachnospiraceae bacterium]